MTAVLLPSGRLRFHATINGVYGPAVGYKLYTYEAGTSTPKATYTDQDGATALSNPIVLDANGECAPYGVGSYKFTLTDPDGAVVDGWPQDNITVSLDATNAEWCSTATGTANAIALTPTLAIDAYSEGQRFEFIAAATNTGAVTVAVSGLAAKSLTWNGNTALANGDLVAGRVYQIQYDGTRFQLLTDPIASNAADNTSRPASSSWVRAYLATQVVSASDTTAGIVELATNAEVQTGTDTTRVITPAGLTSFSKSLATSGYQKFPGGLILQWGRQSASGSFGTITFPIAFPISCLNVSATINQTSSGRMVGVGTLTTTGFDFYTSAPGGSSAESFQWVAIGY